MAALALNLTPVIDELLERPFDRATLKAAKAAVRGDSHAYATALRCAAKRTDDRLVAAYFLTEAACVHESADDLGGELALLWKAREHDRANPRTAELMAACMTRIAMRAGIPFSFRAPVVELDDGSTSVASRPPLETGLRPAAPDRPRDTMPELFGLDVPESTRRTRFEEVDTASDLWVSDSDSELPAPPTARCSELPPPPVKADSDPLVFALGAPRRVELLLPPANPGSPLPKAPSLVVTPVLRAIAELALADYRDAPRAAQATREERLHVVPLREGRPSPSAAARRANDDVYADPATSKTLRPFGDQLVGSLFEALHALHFLDDVRSGAAFLSRVLEEKMHASKILVHVYDINSRHFVVMSALGDKAAVLADYATPDDDAFIVELMKEDEATLVLEPRDDPRLARGRWLLAEPKRSVLSAPVALEGRYLGLIELADPTDGSEFTEDDRNALTYAASAFAQFLDEQGIVLSEDVDEGLPS